MSSPVLLASVLDNGDAAVLAESDGVVDAGSIHALLEELMQAGAAIDAVAVRIVTTPDLRALAGAQHAVRAFSAAGHPVDAVIVTRVPSSKGGWPKAWAQSQRATVESFAAACPVPVVPLRLRPRTRVVPRAMPSAPLRERPLASAPQATADGFRWHLPIDGIDAVSELAIGQEGERLVIQLDGVVVRRPLPAVLSRCIATQASETADGITVAFVRNPDLWPEGAA